jgi:TatD DNase family protein
VIDFHCHLDLFSDPLQVARECHARGVYVLSVTTTPSAWKGTSALPPEGSRIRTALGLHPQLAHERESELGLFDSLIDETKYVGEVGLDGAPEFRVHWESQKRVFEHVLRSCANMGGRVLSIHSRRASEAVVEMLEKYPEAGTPILHWYSGSQRDLSRAIKLGCWFSVGPAMLRSERGRALITAMPRERILTESDGPFAEIDGVAIHPWQIAGAIAGLSEIWETPEDCVDRTLKENLRRLSAVSGVTS